MLVGSFTYMGHTLRLKIHDISNVFYITAYADSMDTALFYDDGVDIDGEVYMPGWRHTGLLMRCGVSRISIKEDYELDGSGTKHKNQINKEAFRELGSVLRSMKNGGTPKNRLGETDTYSAMRAYSYDVQGHHLVIAQGEVKELSYRTETFSAPSEGSEKPEGYVSGSVRGEGTSLELSTVSNDGQVLDYFKGGHGLAVTVDLFSETTPDLGIMDMRDGSEYFTVDEVIAMNSGKNYSWMKERDYSIVTPETLEATCRRIYSAKGIVAFDTETTGLNINFRSREGYGDTLVGMVFTIREHGKNVTFYFPVAHKLLENIASDEKMDHTIEKYFRPILEKKDLAVHNASFDWKVMYLYGININAVIDTLTLTRLTLWNDDTSIPLGLKNLANRLLGRDSFELDDFVEGEWDYNSSFDDLPRETVKYYACADTDNTMDIAIYYEENKTLRRYEAEKVFDIEVLLSRAIGYSEYFGMYADPDDVDSLSKELESTAEMHMKRMVDLIGHEFNPRSPKQLGEVLFTELGIEPIKYTPSGNPSADKSTLKILAAKEKPDGTPMYPFIEELQGYRTAAQLKSNFCDPFEQLSNDGFFHSSVQQFLETGRVSTTKPNYQSFNDEVKKHIIPRDGFYMFDTDFSSIEYRVLVSIAGEQSLVDRFFDPDFDYHRQMAALLHGIPYESVTPELRGASKGLNFGIPYGMTVVGLAERMFGDSSDENVAKAQRLYNKYFDVQPAVRKFFDDTKDLAVGQGYNSTFFGRRRYYDKRKNKINRIRRQAGNHPIQGTAADLYKFGIGRLFLEIFRRGYQGRILINAFVHDEVVIEVHKSINPSELMSIVSNAMMPKIEGWCPLYIGAGFGRSWYEAKSTELPVQIQQKLMSTNLDFWSGDVEELVTWENKMIRQHALDSVTGFLYRVEGQNNGLEDVEETVLPPAEMGYLVDALHALKAGHVEDLSEEALESVSGALDTGTMEDQLQVYASAMGIVSVLENAKITTEVPEAEDTSATVERVTEEELFGKESAPAENLFMTRSKVSGAVLDRKNKKCYVYAKSQPWVDYVSSQLDVDEYRGEYELTMVIDNGGTLESQPVDRFVNTRFASALLKMYVR